jgi:hypothetical protein
MTRHRFLSRFEQAVNKQMKLADKIHQDMMLQIRVNNAKHYPRPLPRVKHTDYYLPHEIDTTVLDEITGECNYLTPMTGKHRSTPGEAVKDFYGNCKKIDWSLEESDPREFIEIKLRGLPAVLLKTLLGTDINTATEMYKLHNSDDPKWCNNYHRVTLDGLIHRFGDDKLGLWAVLRSTGRYDGSLTLEEIIIRQERADETP